MTALLPCLCIAVFGPTVKEVHAEAMRKAPIQQGIVLTQLPARTRAEIQGPLAEGMLRADFGNRGRVVLLNPDGSLRVLSQGFHSAADPAVSFDGTRILFAGKRTASDNWHIFEMDADGANVRQVTQGTDDHRSPSYQPTFYTIVSPKPWYQLTFVKAEKGTLNEYGEGPDTNLYSCKLDGSAMRRLTYNLSVDMDPAIMPDGRLLLASWQRSTLKRGLAGRISLFGVNLDGTDYAAFCGPAGQRIKHMPCATTGGLVVFVEGQTVPWDGAGTLGCVSIRRPLHHYRAITGQDDGLFHSPSALPDGHVLVSRRSAGNTDTHGLFKLDPETGQCRPVFDSPDYHEMQAKILRKQAEPDGRSSVVTEEDPLGKLYCLNVNLSDVRDQGLYTPGTAKRIRILEGMALTENSMEGPEIHGLAQRRLLGEIDLGEDGSFNVAIPGSIPIELQTLDADGMALRTCSWIWAKNHEPRGCIGCHEDGELTPENTLIEAVTRKSVDLTLPPEKRRTVDFIRDVMPIIAGKCVSCHDSDETPVRLTGSLVPETEGTQFNQSYRRLLAAGDTPQQGKYVHPGRARTSPVIWHLFGRNTSRPWDGNMHKRAFSKMPTGGPVVLTEEDRRTFVEWIDMGALWDGIPGAHRTDKQMKGSPQ